MEEWTIINREDGYPSVPEFLKEWLEKKGELAIGLLLFVNGRNEIGKAYTTVLLVGHVNGEGGWCDCCKASYHVRGYKQLEIPWDPPLTEKRGG